MIADLGVPPPLCPVRHAVCPRNNGWGRSAVGIAGRGFWGALARGGLPALLGAGRLRVVPKVSSGSNWNGCRSLDRPPFTYIVQGITSGDDHRGWRSEALNVRPEHDTRWDADLGRQCTSVSGVAVNRTGYIRPPLSHSGGNSAIKAVASRPLVMPEAQRIPIDHRALTADKCEAYVGSGVQMAADPEWTS